MEYQEGTSIGLIPVEVSLSNAINLISTIQLDQALSERGGVSQSSTGGGHHIKSKPSREVILPRPPPQQPKDFLNQINTVSTPKKLLKISNTMENSFTYPKNTIPNEILQTLTTIPNSKSRHQNITPSSSNLSQVNMHTRSRSHYNNELYTPPSVDTNSSLQNTSSQQNQHMYTTKFAKMKFSRQITDSSQELQLQLEAPLTQTQLIKNEFGSPLNKNTTIRLSQDQQTPEEKASNKIKLLDSAIFCIGDTRYFLMFDYKNSIWHQIYFDKHESDYQGTLKFMSICQINLAKKKEFIMTGGCNKVTKEASAQCFRFTIPQMRVFREVSRMKQPRYGHASLYINQNVIVMGGFNHRDDEAQAPQTLYCCEKYSLKENEWAPMAPMIHARAYFSACKVKEEFIYVFGGFHNYETQNSIEFYNIMLDKWTLLSITMPIKIAKYGLAKVDENQIIIAGGLLVDNSSSGGGGGGTTSGDGQSYSCLNTVYKFDCNTLKWTKLAKLNFRRNMFSTMAVKENYQIFAIGGTVDGINEVYDVRKKKWNTCQSYTNIVGQNDLQTYAICSLSSKISDE